MADNQTHIFKNVQLKGTDDNIIVSDVKEIVIPINGKKVTITPDIVKNGNQEVMILQTHCLEPKQENGAYLYFSVIPGATNVLQIRVNNSNE